MIFIGSTVRTSAELQEIVLSSLLKNPYLLSKVKSEIKISFFEKISYKLIYKALIYYYSKYAQLPSSQSLVVVINDLYTPEYGSLVAITEDLTSLYNIPINSEDFVIDTVTRFIRRYKVEQVLSDVIPRLKSGESISVDDLGEKLSESVSINLSQSKVFRLSDSTNFPEIRRKAVGTDLNPVIIKSSIDAVNYSLQFGGYKLGDVVTITARPGCGKTMFLVNELSNAAMQGYNVLHIFVGDMSEYDGWIRYLSNVSSMPQNDIVEMTEDEQIELARKLNYNGHVSRINVLAYAAGEVSIGQVLMDITKAQSDFKVHYDVIAIDYPDNLTSESDMMYESGGKIYDEISKFASHNRSVIFTGSQPKVTYWNQELIPMEGCAESSKKQQIIDTLITLGRPTNDSPLLTGYLAKVRRGKVGSIFRMETKFERAYLEQISEADYIKLKNQQDMNRPVAN